MVLTDEEPVLEPICPGDTCPDHDHPQRPSLITDRTPSLTETGGWGFSYGPLPMTQPGAFPNDYMMAKWMRGQWSWDGRNDLGVMHQMGAKMIRLYGNDPRMDATDFLDQAHGWGIKVIVGVSDYPYTQAPDNCLKNGMDCYQNLHDSYMMDLENGAFLGDDGMYHPALDTLIIVNEPDLKFVTSADPPGPRPDYMKVVLSAFDGILAAEKERGLDITSRDNIKFTVAFSYATCEKCPNMIKLRALGCCILCWDEEDAKNNHKVGMPCSKLGKVGKPWAEGGMKCVEPRKPNNEDNCPGLPMIMDLHAAFDDPASVGYKFKTKGWEKAFENRWVHSLNAFVEAQFLEEQFISKYMKLPFNNGQDAENMVPLFMGEYGDSNMAKNPEMLGKDLQKIIAMVQDLGNPLFGFSLFQFQVAYNKPCQQEEWDAWQTDYWDDPLASPPPGSCAERLYGTFALGDIQVSRTGHVDNDNKHTYNIQCLKPIFKGKPEAVAQAFGGTAPDTTVCQQGWQANPPQYCVSSRGQESVIGKAYEFVCDALGQEGKSCNDDVPLHCNEDLYSKADWAFSKYFELHKNSPDQEPWEICNFDGAGVLTPLPARPECVLTTKRRIRPASPTHSPDPTPGNRPEEPGGSESGGLSGLYLPGLIIIAVLGGAVACLGRRRALRQRQEAIETASLSASHGRSAASLSANSRQVSQQEVEMNTSWVERGLSARELTVSTEQA